MKKRRIKYFNEIITCQLCNGYLIEPTTINTCVHSFCRSCILKHLILIKNNFCPQCGVEVRLSNLRLDMRLRSIVYKIIPDLYAKEEDIKQTCSQKSLLHLIDNEGLQSFDRNCSENRLFENLYFYSQDEPISLSLEYHMESIFGNSTSLTNIPQIRYLQAPAAFKISLLKKFISSKYDLHHVKKSMKIDILHEGDVLSNEFTLMDVAYSYFWDREAPLKLYYRIYNNNRKHEEANKKIKSQSQLLSCEAEKTKTLKNESQVNGNKNYEAFPKDFKIIIAKKSNNKTKVQIDSTNTKIKLNKLHGIKNRQNERMRGDAKVVNFTSKLSSGIASTPKANSRTLAHHDLNLEGNHAAEQPSFRHSNNINDSPAGGETQKSQNNANLRVVLPVARHKFHKSKGSKSSSYFIASKSPSSEGDRSPVKKVRFESDCRESQDDTSSNLSEQLRYAESIGLKPVKRKVDSIILHRKNKKMRISHQGSKSEPKNQVQVSSSLDESLKLRLKIVNPKGALPKAKQNDEKKKSKGDDVDVENCKYSVSEHKNGGLTSDQPMVFIPKLVFQRVKTATETEKTASKVVTEQKESQIEKPVKEITEKEKTAKGEDKNQSKHKSSVAISIVESSKLKLMNPPRARMGSPKQPQTSHTLASPIRPHSHPTSLKFSMSPVSSSSIDFPNQSLMKRSVSCGSEKSPSYLKKEIKTIGGFQSPSSSRSATTSVPARRNSRECTSSVRVKSSEKLLERPPVKLIEIPQETSLRKIGFRNPVESTTGSGLTITRTNFPNTNSFDHKSQGHKNQNKTQATFCSFPAPPSHPIKGSDCVMPLVQDISLKKYTLELTNDIAQLDRNLSLEKNFEHWERRKLQEYSKLNETITMLNQQNLSVRNVPNPSAIIRSRNQAQTMSPVSSYQGNQPKNLVQSSASFDSSDIEDILSKSLINKKDSGLQSQKSFISKLDDRRSIEKLTEYLKLTATKMKFNNNNNNDSSNKNQNSYASNSNFKHAGSKSESFGKLNLLSTGSFCHP